MYVIVSYYYEKQLFDFYYMLCLRNAYSITALYAITSFYYTVIVFYKLDCQVYSLDFHFMSLVFLILIVLLYVT